MLVAKRAVQDAYPSLWDDGEGNRKLEDEYRLARRPPGCKHQIHNRTIGVELELLAARARTFRPFLHCNRSSSSLL